MRKALVLKSIGMFEAGMFEAGMFRLGPGAKGPPGPGYMTTASGTSLLKKVPEFKRSGSANTRGKSGRLSCLFNLLYSEAVPQSVFFYDWRLWSIKTIYLEECPSVWVSLVFPQDYRFRFYTVGRNTTEMMYSSGSVISGGTWYPFLL